MSSDDLHEEQLEERKRGDLYLDQTPLTHIALQKHSSMWPRIASDVPPGWDVEVARALAELAQLSAETGVEIRIAQIKSKFAGLRIYLDIAESSVGPLEPAGASPMSVRFRTSAKPGSVRQRAMAVVDAAAHACSTRCEVCGEQGVVVNKAGYLLLACPAYAGSK